MNVSGPALKSHVKRVLPSRQHVFDSDPDNGNTAHVWVFTSRQLSISFHTSYRYYCNTVKPYFYDSRYLRTRTNCEIVQPGKLMTIYCRINEKFRKTFSFGLFFFCFCCFLKFESRLLFRSTRTGVEGGRKINEC